MNLTQLSPVAGPPFFLVGSVRSGTTVLRLMLGHHPQICRCDELEYVAGEIAGRNDWPDVAEYVRRLPRHHGYRQSGFVPDVSMTFPAMVQDFFAQLRKADSRELAGATVHNHFDELTRIWQDAKFIHLVRDPRDVARSCVEIGWAGNAWAGIGTWLAADDAWQRLVQRLPPEQRLEVRFEDLTSRTESELARICEFIGVSYDPAMIEIEADSTYRRPNPRDARSWRDGAPPTEVREMEARLGGRLVRAGYSPSGLSPLKLSIGRRFALDLDHRFRRMRFSQRRYGILKWVAHAVLRRLDRFRLLDLPRKRLQTAFDTINRHHMK
ncbi:MAG: sulfotransferase [Caldimonas sp.]